MIFKSDKEKSFTKEEAIDLMVSLSSTDANSEKKWRGFYNSLSQSELQGEWEEYWRTWKRYESKEREFQCDTGHDPVTS